MDSKARKPLFVFGYPRSGTTLLWSLLNTHSGIRLLLEPELIRGMIFAGMRFSDRVKSGQREELLEKMKRLGVTERHLKSLPAGRVSDFINAATDLSFKEMYEQLLPKPREARIWGEKSLGNAFYIEKLYELYPNAVFVNIVRNPAAALLSHYRKKNAASRSARPVLNRRTLKFFASSTLLWKQWLAAVEKSRRQLKDATIIQVVYKDLVNDPEKKLREICESAGIDFEPGMLELSHRKKSSPISSEFKYAHKNLDRPIDPKRAQAGSELPEWATYVVEKYAAREIKKYGFQLGEQRIRFREKIKIEAQLFLLDQRIRSGVSQYIADRSYHRAPPAH